MGEPVKDGKAFAACYAPECNCTFHGEHRPMMPDGSEVVIPAAAMEDVMNGLVGGFTDFCFNKKKAEWVQAEDGAWVNTNMYQFGTHDGPYAPMPGLEPIAATGKEAQEGPEKFTIYFDGEGKITKFMVEPLTDGPSGPPGMYVLIGGKLG